MGKSVAKNSKKPKTSDANTISSKAGFRILKKAPLLEINSGDEERGSTAINSRCSDKFGM